MGGSAGNRITGAYVGSMLVLATAAVADLIVHADARVVLAEYLELATFLTLGVAWSLLIFKLGKRRRGTLAVSLAPASYLALAPIADGATVLAVALLVSAFDWACHRRKPLVGLFNSAQTVISIWAAIQVAAAVSHLVPGPLQVGAAAVLGSIAASLVGVLTMSLVVYLAEGRRPGESGALSYNALNSEIIVACFAGLLALGWSRHPLLIALSVVPMTMLFQLLGRLEQREVSLERRKEELQAIQELGLEVGARLESEDLSRVVTRSVAEDLRAAGALLAFVSENRRAFEVRAVYDARERGVPPPPRLLRRTLDDAFLENGRPCLWDGKGVRMVPEMDVFEAAGMIALPLRVLGRADAVLIAYHDGRREPFGDEDVSRLTALARFVEVALSNARLYDDLRRMQEQLVQREKLSALGELVSGVAHELNNPLAVVIGNSEMLARQDLPPGAQRIAGTIEKEAARAARIVRDLLAFSRNQKPERSWHDVGSVIQEVVQLKSQECAERDIQVRAELSPEVPPLLIDPHQIHQVLLNLVTNAVHAIEDANRPGTVVVRTLRAGARVHIVVVDDGPGIPEEVLPKIFNPFFTTKKVGRGTGLGLSICYGIVQAHGGAFRVRSVPGQGATFIIELAAPRPEELEREFRTESEERPISPALEGRGRHVLVVDDEEGVRSIVRDALELWGFSVDEASSGEGALSMLSSCRFDLVVTDLRMPGLDGPGLYGEAGSLCAKVPPFVFVTGDAASREMRAFLDGVRAPVLVKPFTLMSLREAVEIALHGVPAPTVP